MYRKVIFLMLVAFCYGACKNDPSPKQEGQAPSDPSIAVDKQNPHSILIELPSRSLSQAEKVAICRQLFDALWAASDHRFGKVKPKLKWTRSESHGAFYDTLSKDIFVEEKAFDICLALGEKHFKPALAFIIAHELAHHFQNSTLQTAFMGAQSSFLGYDNIPHAYPDLEGNADLSGAFNMYLAGISPATNTLTILIDSLYQGYEVTEDPSSYPPRRERKKSAQKVQEQLKELVALYEAAAILSAIGADDAAISAWEILLRFYQGREVYANLGVAEARKALRLLEKNDDRFRLIFPLETDWETRLRLKIPDMAGLPDPHALLRAATEHLERALAIDHEYDLAALNLFIVRILNERSNDSLNDIVYTFDQINQRKGWPEEYRHTATLALANAYHLRGKNERTSWKADSLWQILTMGKDTLLAEMARYNRYLKQNPKTDRQWPNPVLPSAIRQEEARHPLALTTFQKDSLKAFALNNRIKAYYQEANAYSLLYLEMNGTTKITLKRIPMKNPVTAVRHPREMRLSSKGSIIVVPSNKIGYRTNKGRIVEYFKYHITH